MQAEDKRLLEPTISIKTDAEPDGTFSVYLIVTGLTSEAQASAASAHLQRLFCGPEIVMNDGAAAIGEKMP